MSRKGQNANVKPSVSLAALLVVNRLTSQILLDLTNLANLNLSTRVKLSNCRVDEYNSDTDANADVAVEACRPSKQPDPVYRTSGSAGIGWTQAVAVGCAHEEGKAGSRRGVLHCR